MLREPDGVRTTAARPEDAERIRSLSAPFAGTGLIVDRPLAELAGRLHEFTVARHRNAVIGCAGTSTVGDVLVVYNVCVASAWQRRGVGRLLVGAAADAGRAQGFPALLALTRHGAWFERLGFDAVPEHEVRAEWRDLFRPGRGSRLYQLSLTVKGVTS
jgi:N-acetylglutamate synthase-like GNAT family acetyltransferase